MSEQKKKRRYKAKPSGWSKSEGEERINSPNKENPFQEDDMDEKEVQALMDKREQKLLDRVNKKYGGDTPPGGDKVDQEIKDYFDRIDKIGQSVEKQGKILEGLYGEREQKETDNRLKAIAEGIVEPVTKELKVIKGMLCDENGNCWFPTKKELANLKTEQDRKLEKIREESKKTEQAKPDLSQFSGQELWEQIKKNETYVEDVGKIHIKRVKEDPDYRAKMLDILCDPKNEQCRVDVMEKFNKFSEHKEKTEKEEKTPEGKKFFLVK